MDMKVSSSSGAICTIRTPVGMSLPGARKSCLEQGAFWALRFWCRFSSQLMRGGTGV
jgi:hypothetical protein